MWPDLILENSSIAFEIHIAPLPTSLGILVCRSSLLQSFPIQQHDQHPPLSQTLSFVFHNLYSLASTHSIGKSLHKTWYRRRNSGPARATDGPPADLPPVRPASKMPSYHPQTACHRTISAWGCGSSRCEPWSWDLVAQVLHGLHEIGNHKALSATLYWARLRLAFRRERLMARVKALRIGEVPWAGVCLRTALAPSALVWARIKLHVGSGCLSYIYALRTEMRVQSLRIDVSGRFMLHFRNFCCQVKYATLSIATALFELHSVMCLNQRRLYTCDVYSPGAVAAVWLVRQATSYCMDVLSDVPGADGLDHCS